MPYPTTTLAGATAIIAALLLTSAAVAQNADAHRYWPQWRGPLANGVATAANPPLEWSETRNVRWKVEIPGRGSSSPIVWGDRLYLSTAIPVGVAGDAQHAPRGGLRPRGVHRFVVMAIDRKTGRTSWERVAHEQEPHEAAHNDNGTWANGSPITDGQHIYAYFESFGLYAYDMNGTLRWEKDLGDKRMRNEFGEGSTPALYGNTLVIVWDHLKGDGSFVVALDKRDGKELAYVPSPIIADGVLYFLKTNSGIVSAFDAKTGKPHYQNQRLDGVPNVFSSPVAARGRVYFTGREGATIVLKTGPTYEVLAKNTLDDGFDASPALVDNEIFMRGYKYLYAIAQP